MKTKYEVNLKLTLTGRTPRRSIVGALQGLMGQSMRADGRGEANGKVRITKVTVRSIEGANQ